MACCLQVISSHCSRYETTADPCSVADFQLAGHPCLALLLAGIMTNRVHFGDLSVY